MTVTKLFRKIRLGELEIDLEELEGFLVAAKRNGYAGSEGKKRETDGSKTFTYQEGNFHYTDNYAGSYQAPGNEIVRWQKDDGQRIWYMAYSGGMLPAFRHNDILSENTFKFLKEVLMLVTPELPFRGPLRHENTGFEYLLEINGDIKRFSGGEIIRSKRLKDVVFSQDLIGGLVIPKIK